MKVTSFLILLLLFSSCGGDEIQLPTNDLEGMIEGVTWEYSSANAYRLSTDGQYQVRFISKEEPVSDPCSLPSPGRTHVKAIFRPGIGSFSVSPQAINNNQVQVAFEISTSKTLLATSGFLEIYDINGGSIVGYLQASEDGVNTVVEGRVQIRICN